LSLFLLPSFSLLFPFSLCKENEREEREVKKEKRNERSKNVMRKREKGKEKIGYPLSPIPYPLLPNPQSNKTPTLNEPSDSIHLDSIKANTYVFEFLLCDKNYHT
jgi:hypothetical protein